MQPFVPACAQAKDGLATFFHVATLEAETLGAKEIGHTVQDEGGSNCIGAQKDFFCRQR